MVQLIPIFSIAITIFATSAEAQIGGPKGVPRPSDEAIEGVSIEQKLGSQVPLDLIFKKESGESVRLADLVEKKPVILNLVYYEPYSLQPGSQQSLACAQCLNL